MAIPFRPKIITSNHLLEGDVIYFTSPAGWSRHITDAVVAQTQEEADRLLAEAKTFPHETVGVEFSDVDLSTGRPQPSHFREMFRTKGPSNYFHGKQAEHV